MKTLHLADMRGSAWVMMLLACAGCSGHGPQANGSILTWMSSTTDAVSVPPLPVPRANHCSAASGKFVYVIGGNYKPAGAADFVAIADVSVATQNPDGTLGAWSTAGALPSALTQCTATSDGKRVYIVGGIFADATNGGQVWAADIAANGTLSPFTALGPLPDGHLVISAQAWVRDQTLFAFDSDIATDTGGTDGIVLLHAPIDPALGAWTVDAGPPGFRGRPQYAAAGKFIYALGGYLSGDQGNPVVADGFGAPFSTSTGMGLSFTVASLPAPRAYGVGIAVDDYVYVFGGKDEIFAGAGEADVYSAHIAVDGTLAPFVATTSLPEGRTNLDAVALGDFIYVTGGGTTAGGLDNVFAARVRF